MPFKANGKSRFTPWTYNPVNYEQAASYGYRI